MSFGVFGKWVARVPQRISFKIISTLLARPISRRDLLSLQQVMDMMLGAWLQRTSARTAAEAAEQALQREKNEAERLGFEWPWLNRKWGVLFLRKTGDMSGLVDVVARNPWMISMLIWKSYTMLSCCMITAKPDASDLLMFVADG